MVEAKFLHPSQARAPNDPAWPRGYPYECLATWTDPTNQAFTITIGTLGQVTTPPNNRGYVVVTRPYSTQSPAQLWVPLNFIRVVTVKRYGDVDDQVPTLDARPSTQAITQSTQLGKAVAQWTLALRDNLQSMRWLPVWLRNRLQNGRLRGQLVDVLMEGTTDTVREILNKLNFTITDVLNSPVINKNHQSPGIYTCIYSVFNDHKQWPSQYVGKSVNPFTKR